MGVVDESINSFLKHTLFVAADDFRSIEFEKLFQAVVTVNDAAIEIVKIGSRETTTRERNHRA